MNSIARIVNYLGLHACQVHKLVDAKWFHIFVSRHCNDTNFQSLLIRKEIELQLVTPEVQTKHLEFQVHTVCYPLPGR
jgi:hypothetical protein